MKSPKAFTLTETMISLGLFASFMLAISVLYVTAWQAMRSGEDPSRAKQVGYGAFFRMCHAVRATPALIQPDLSSWNGTPQAGLVLREAGRVTAFRSNQNLLEELYYRPDYSPWAPASWRLVDGSPIPLPGPLELSLSTSPRPVKSLVEGLQSFAIDQPLAARPSLLHLQMELVAGQEHFTLDTCVNLREAL